MSYQSKFTERFDINPSDSLLQDIMAPPSPRNSSSVYSSPELNGSDNSIEQTKGSRPIAIPQKKKNKHMSITPPYSPPRGTTEKNQDAFSTKFKQFFSISKKKDGSAAHFATSITSA